MFDQANQMMGAWARVSEEAVGRAEAFWGEAAKIESKSAEQAGAFVDEWARLVRETIGYSVAVGEQMRRMSLEAMRPMQPPAAAPKREQSAG